MANTRKLPLHARQGAGAIHHKGRNPTSFSSLHLAFTLYFISQQHFFIVLLPSIINIPLSAFIDAYYHIDCIATRLLQLYHPALPNVLAIICLAPPLPIHRPFIYIRVFWTYISTAVNSQLVTMARVKEMYQSVKQRVKKESPRPSRLSTPATFQDNYTVDKPAGRRYSENIPGEPPNALSLGVSALESLRGKAPASPGVSALQQASEAVLVRPASGSKEEFPPYNEASTKESEQSSDATHALDAADELPAYTSSPPRPLTVDVLQRLEQAGLAPIPPLKIQQKAEPYLDSEGQELVDQDAASNHSDMIQTSRSTGRNSISVPKLNLPPRCKFVDSGFFGSTPSSTVGSMPSSAALDGTFDVHPALRPQSMSKDTSPTATQGPATDAMSSRPSSSVDKPSDTAPKIPMKSSARRLSWGITQSLNTFKSACTTLKANVNRVPTSNGGPYHATSERLMTQSPESIRSPTRVSSCAKCKRDEYDDVSPITPLDKKADIATPERPQSQEGETIAKKADIVMPERPQSQEDQMIGKQADIATPEGPQIQEDETIAKSLYGTIYDESCFVPKLESMDPVVPMSPEEAERLPKNNSVTHADRRSPSQSSSVYSERGIEGMRDLDHDLHDLNGLHGPAMTTSVEEECGAQVTGVSDPSVEPEEPKQGSDASHEGATQAVVENVDDQQRTQQPDISINDEEGASEVERMFDAVFVGWRTDDTQRDPFPNIQPAVVAKPATIDGPTNSVDEPCTPRGSAQIITPSKDSVNVSISNVHDENISPKSGSPNSWTGKARKLANRKSGLWDTWKKSVPAKLRKVSGHDGSASALNEGDVKAEDDAGDCEGSGE